MKFVILIMCLVLSGFASQAQRKQYSGSHHTSSHGGHYSSGSGSSHRGGHYRNSSTHNQYGRHKRY